MPNVPCSSGALSFGSLAVFISLLVTAAGQQNEGIAIWANSGSTNPGYALWDRDEFFKSGGMRPTRSRWVNTRGAYSPSRDEAIVVGVTFEEKVTAQMYTGGKWIDLPFSPLDNSADNNWRHGFDVAYESQSGNALLVWNKGVQDAIYYRTWNGTEWSKEFRFDSLIKSGTNNRLFLASNPISNEMVLAVSVFKRSDYCAVWNGRDFDGGFDLRNEKNGYEKAIDVAYEQESGRAVVVYGKLKSSSVGYRIFAGSEWSREYSVLPPREISGNVKQLALGADASTNRIALAVTTFPDNAYWLAIWDGNLWGSTTTAISNMERQPHHAIAVAFESSSGRALATYTTESTSQIKYRVCETGGGWSREYSGPNLGDEPNTVRLSSSRNGNGIMLSVQDNGQDANFCFWNGKSFEKVNRMTDNTGDGTKRALNHLFLWKNRRATASPTAPPTIRPTEKPTGCVDVPQGWHDPDGEIYNCAWYSLGDNCKEYGDFFENFGATANTACCGCGGGNLVAVDEITQTPPPIPVTVVPTVPPSPVPTPRPSPPPTSSPTPSRTTATPTANPTDRPTMEPSVKPTKGPTRIPTKAPSANPTRFPTLEPSARPTQGPTRVPTLPPTRSPTVSPTSVPTLPLTMHPTSTPTKGPTLTPSNPPTAQTQDPTVRPTLAPTTSPTAPQTTNPTMYPTQSPSTSVTPSPTQRLTPVPSQRPSPFPSNNETAQRLSPIGTAHPTLAPTNVSKFKLPPDAGDTDNKVQVDAEPGSLGAGKQCSNNRQCKSSTCRSGVCMASPDCYPIKHTFGTPFYKHKVNIVFVASAFDSVGHDAWEDQVNRTYRFMQNYNMFAEEINELNVFMVDPLNLDESFCNLGCQRIDRLLCCDVNRAHELGSKCFPVGSNLQTVVIHNSRQYGGAGYTNANIATVTMHPAAPLVLVHELGHSLFELTDEYSSGDGNALEANCDSSLSCQKWSDLMGRKNRPRGYDRVQCIPGCMSSNYFVSGKTFMDELTAPVGAVNERFSCCTYLALTKKFPSYCQNFDAPPGYLREYCMKDYQNYGASNYETEEVLAIPGFANRDKTSAKYMRVADPVMATLTSKRKQSGATVFRTKTSRLETGMFPKSQVKGDFSSPKAAAKQGVNSLLKVLVIYRTGKEILFFSRNKTIEIPQPDPDRSDSGLQDETPLRVSTESEVLELVLDTNRRKIKKIRAKIIDAQQ